MNEIITFGEALLRLTPPGHLRLEQATSLDLEVGGAELNTVVGLARLGHGTAWVSRLPDSPLGRMMAGRVRAAGVNDTHVKYGDGRAGIYFLEEGAAPRASAIVYDRADSSMARIMPGEFDWATIFQGAKWFHVTGISAALSDSSAKVVFEALAVAKNTGLKTSVDLNYRSKLWGAADAGRVMGEVIRDCDVLFASENDAKLLFGIDGSDFATVAFQLHERFGVKAVATMRRDSHLLWRDRVQAIGWCDGTTIESKAHEVEVVDRIGTGDAFAAGVIHGMLTRDFASGIETGAAMAALAHTIRGDLPLVNPDEVQAAIDGAGLRIRR